MPDSTENTDNVRFPGQPTAWKLLKIWLAIGAQSFGGGSVTFQLIRQEMVSKRNWITELEFIEMNTLSVLVPGINLLAIAVQIGHRLAGWRGIAATLAGMLLPSSLITAFLTAGFTAIQNWPPFQQILKGILPATAALMFVVFSQTSLPLLKVSLQESKLSLLVATLFIAVSTFLISFLNLPVWLVLLFAAVAGALIFPRLNRPASKPATSETEQQP